MAEIESKHLEKLEDLSFFDNQALYYLCNETPPPTLALAFLYGEPKIVGSMLGVLEKSRREYIHKLMSQQNNVSTEVKEQAVAGLLVVAEGLIARNLIEKKGKFYYGVKKGS